MLRGSVATVKSTVKSAESLRSSLAGLSPEALAELLADRRVPAAVQRTGRAPQDLARLVELLLDDRSVGEAVARLNLPGFQLLSAGVWLAARLHGPLQEQPYWTPFEPSTKPVPSARLLDCLSGDDPALRAAAERLLADLQRQALVLPTPDPDQLALPAFVHRHLSEVLGFGRPVAQLMTDAFNAPEVHRIAAGLDLEPNRNRELAQAAVAAALGDPERVRSLVSGAPKAALDLLDRMVPGPPLLRTHCFQPLGGYHYGPGTKYQLSPAGSGDAGTDWLAAHGMIVPTGPDLVELPFEVFDALADGRPRLRFTPEPPALGTGVHPVPDALREAQAAAATASRKVELLLAACAAAPPGVRKAGGLAVRDTKRLAKAVDAADEQTRLWIDLAYNADLLGTHQDQPDTPAPRGRGRRPAAPTAPVQLLPSERYDRWQTRSPADRLVPVICAWAVVPEVFSWWPDFREETPVALVTPQDQEAVPLRREVLRALATLPPGHGLGPVSKLGQEALEGLLRLINWQSPGLIGIDGADAERAVLTVQEAELLGVVAHGRLTPVGESVLALLETDAADWFPYVPGVSATDGEEYEPALRSLRAALAELLPPPQETARFQADLTAIAAGAPSSALAELLGSAADRESEGHAVVWRFSAGSVRRALDSGLAADDLLTGLREVAEGSLPQPLEYLVRDTGRTHGRVRVVRSACCIRSDDETLLVELEKARMLAKLELRLIAPTVLISTQPPTATLQALRAAGYAPVLEAETGVTVVERAPELRAATRMPALARRHSGRTEQPAVLEAATRLLAGG